MKNAAIVVAVLLLAGCASTQSPETNQAPHTESIALGHGASGSADIRITSEAYTRTFVVPVARDSLFNLFPEAFDALGLPAPSLDRRTWTAAVRDHTVQRRLNGERLSRLLECGSGPIGRYADTRRIEIDLTVRLQPAAKGTSVATDVIAHSYDPTGRTTNTECTSRGVLERMVADALAAASDG